MANSTIAASIKEAFPDIEWDKFEDMDRAVNWELWHGPLPANYWTEVEPLDHYTWRGYEQGVKDIEEILDPLPTEMFYEHDSDCVTTNNPEDDMGNWEFRCEVCEEHIRTEDDGGTWSSIDDLNSNCNHSPDYNKEPFWLGGEWEVINVRQALMYVETYKHIF